MISNPLAGVRYCIHTFGCQMNKHDSERIAGALEDQGAVEVSSIDESEIIVFVTCCVREAADVRLKGQVASLKNIPLPKDSAFSKRIVCIGGCIGQRDGESLFDEFPHVDVVFGTQNTQRFIPLLISAVQGNARNCEVEEESDSFSSDMPSKRESAWSAWLPITVGCNNFCTYCIVPYVRGRERSRVIEDVEAEARLLVADGVKEITLLGQNVNSYGRDLYGEPRFADVLRAVSRSGVERIRFATSHPKDLTDEVIGLFGELENLMPALHLPVQSGSDAVLKAMNRRYTADRYLSLIDKMRDVRPDVALSTDIIVGFPGETEEDFRATYDLVKQVGYSQVFTFIYSRRSGTPAAKMTDATPKSVIQRRFDALVDLVQEGAFAANQQYAGTMQKVLFEGVSKRNEQILSGRTEHNITVHAPVPSGMTAESLQGSILDVAIDEAKTWYLNGTVLDG